MTASVDAVVIGAGPAGSVAAALLAQRGMRTVLCERERFPRDKACGCCLGPRGAAALEECGLAEALDGAGTLERVSLGSGGSWATLPMRGTRVIGRDALDARLAGAAAARGCDVRMGVRASVIHAGDGASPSLVTLHSAEGSETTISAQVVICADGLGGRSLAPLDSAFGWIVSRASRFGAAARLGPEAMDVPAGELWMMAGADGYAGAVRLPCGRIDLAAALDPAAARQAGGPEPLVRTIFERCGRRMGESAGVPWRGTPTLTRRRARTGLGRVMCIGDAAGYVEPFTGEGMSWAVEGAQLAAAAAPAIASAGDARPWHDGLVRALGRHQRRCRAISAMLRFPRISMTAVRAASRVPALSRRISAIATGVAR